MKVIISGALGRMGRAVYESAKADGDIEVIAGVDANAAAADTDFPVYASFDKISDEADCVIDFSSPAALDGILDYSARTGAAAVLCTTGYDENQLEKIKKHAEKCAVFKSANMSLGVNVLINLCKKAAEALGGFDVEIIEAHHNRKVDAPSGTALMLADGIKEVSPDKFYVYGREGKPGKRDQREIGIHAVRGGNIVGKHEVVFAGENEVITLKHEAESRSVFAVGAVKAAKYVSTKKSGIYDMQDLIENA